MKYSLFIIFLIIFPATIFSQSVQFRDGQFQNGMTYPMIIFTSNRSVELAINKDIEANIETFKGRDFCIGQYGYVQKTSFLQIHLYVNCIDMDDSEDYYYLYDLETGKISTVAAMLNKKTENEFNRYFLTKVKSFVQSQSIELGEEESLDGLVVSDMNTILDKDGIHFFSTKLENWGDKRMFIKYTDLQTYLKITYI